MNNLMLLSSSEKHFCLLTSNGYNQKDSQAEFIAAWGCVNDIKSKSFIEIKEFTKSNNWSFGYFGYDLKNDTEQLQSTNEDLIYAPDSYFFVPQYIIVFRLNDVFLYSNETKENIDNTIEFLLSPSSFVTTDFHQTSIKSKESKEKYIDAVNQIKSHIKKGNIYEANYCTEFYAENYDINVQSLFQNLTSTSPNPFSAFLKFDEFAILSASPERFMQRVGNKIISQPIKGTSKRSADLTIDQAIKNELRNSVKDQTENIMIVDLVRNDLSKTAIKGSVKVEELCEVYSFPHVHQMISTVSCLVKPEINNIDIIKEAFPPGSMTGAPKVKAMELMEQFEKTKRGIYSGAIGYFAPNGNFDFSVVIRTIIYNLKNKQLSFMVGGAITDKSVPEMEYQECLTKAQAMLKALNVKDNSIENNA